MEICVHSSIWNEGNKSNIEPPFYFPLTGSAQIAKSRPLFSFSFLLFRKDDDVTMALVCDARISSTRHFLYHTYLMLLSLETVWYNVCEVFFIFFAPHLAILVLYRKQIRMY